MEIGDYDDGGHVTFAVPNQKISGSTSQQVRLVILGLV